MSNNLSSLQELLTITAINSSEFKEALKKDLNEIKEIAKSAENEATLVGGFERVLYATLKKIGISFNPQKETYIESEGKVHVKKGRTDSRIGAVIVEYKHPDKLKIESDINEAKDQIKNYLEEISKNKSTEIYGFLTDGLHSYEFRAINGEIFSESSRQRLSVDIILRFVKSIHSLSLSALNSENLIRDFCGSSNDGVLFESARILNNTLKEKDTPKTEMLRSEWEQIFRLSHEDQSQQRRIEERRKELSNIFNESLTTAESEYRCLFALHTAYSIVLKLIAYRIVASVQFGKPPVKYKAFLKADNIAIRPFCERLEDGEVFRELGILNLLEGDFFSWYADGEQWNPELAQAIKQILTILARYEDTDKVFSENKAVDLFRDLYESAVPQVVRSSFGEFYTPVWLADHVIDSALEGSDEDWKLLDPCCGSGTFVITAISKLRNRLKGESKKKIFKEIYSRIKAIDLNPLAVLTARVHYFIHTADLIPDDQDKFVIPVFLGDASNVPEIESISGVECVSYQLQTLKDPININIPRSLVQDSKKFVEAMVKVEQFIKTGQQDNAYQILLSNIPASENKEEIKSELDSLVNQLIKLEENGWDGIWARILTNFLTTACLSDFTVIVGNPPWIDWKNLPTGYREKVKSLCIDKGLFSGAGRTGGINLNICALITHVAISNWLVEDGKLAFLMPKELAYQASYEGWREAVGGAGRNFIEFHDWSKSGHPFYPVTEDFMTFLIGNEKQQDSMETYFYKKKRGKPRAHKWDGRSEANENLEVEDRVAGQIIENSTAFTITDKLDHLFNFNIVAGEASYIGREGIEFYPQELFLFRYVKPGPREGTVFLKNIQKSRSKYKIPEQERLFETKYLYPLVKGPAIDSFGLKYDDLIVPFPYTPDDPHRPLSPEILAEESPLLLSYFRNYQEVIEAQTDFSDKIRGQDPGAFYGLARTGPYSFKDIHVGYRDNTKWRSVVVKDKEMPWGERKRYLFQNHAVSICEGNDKRDKISIDEAHFICGIMNSPIVEEFIYCSSDSRSFKIRPPVNIPLYSGANSIHRKISELSKKAHLKYGDKKALKVIRNKIEKLYLKVLNK